MQTPEVHNFPAPHSTVSVEKFENLNNTEINNFHFNHSLSFILSNKLTDNLFDSFAENNLFYKIINFNIEDLADARFISSFIRNGKLTLLTVNTRVDCDNCIGITDNLFYLNLDKESYQSLGLDGRVSYFTKKIKNRFVISIDFSDKTFLTNQLKLNQLKSSLKTLKKCSIIFTWEPPTVEICPSSIAKYFADSGYSIKEQIPIVHSHSLRCNIPKPDEENINEIVEWLGMVALECELEEDVTGYLSTYTTPENTEIGDITCVNIRGLFSSNTTVDLIKKVRKRLELVPEKWIGIYIQGFSDCPVAWNKEEHHFYVNGDNGYVLILNKDRGIICKQKCSRKIYK